LGGAADMAHWKWSGRDSVLSALRQYRTFQKNKETHCYAGSGINRGAPRVRTSPDMAFSYNPRALLWG
jgi:hypothetical protein